MPHSAQAPVVVARGVAVLGDDVGHRHSSAGAEDPGDLGEDRCLVGREADDAVGDDDVDRCVGEWHVLDETREEDGVGDTSRCRVGSGDVDHLVEFVDAVSDAGRSDPLG